MAASQGINQWDIDPVQAYLQYSALLLDERKNELFAGWVLSLFVCDKNTIGERPEKVNRGTEKNVR